MTTVLADGQVVDDECAGRHELVYGLHTDDLRDDADHFLATGSGYVKSDFHSVVLLNVFPLGYYIYHSEGT